MPSTQAPSGHNEYTICFAIILAFCYLQQLAKEQKDQNDEIAQFRAEMQEMRGELEEGELEEVELEEKEPKNEEVMILWLERVSVLEKSHSNLKRSFTDLQKEVDGSGQGRSKRSKH